MGIHNFSSSINDGTMTEDAASNDVIFSGAYGWIFSILTAFCLLVFLAYSFVCYHRRLATRKARDDEYAEFVHVYRPDLESRGLKKPRATINAYSAGILASGHKPSSYAYVNEGFEYGPAESARTIPGNNTHRSSTEDIDYMIQAEFQLHNNTKHDGNLPEFHGNLPGRRGKLPEHPGKYSAAKSQSNSITKASVHSNEFKHDANEDTLEYDAEVFEDYQTVENADKTKSIYDKHKCIEQASRNDSTSSSMISAQVKHKPPHARQGSSSKIEPAERKTCSEDDTEHFNWKLTRKRQTFEQGAKRKSALSFDEDVPYMLNHYTVPRRQSESATYMLEYNAPNESENGPRKSVQFNPYYVEMGRRLDYRPSTQQQRQRRNTYAHVEPITYSTYVQDIPEQQNVNTPVSGEMSDVYYGDIEHSTWM